MSKFFIYAIIFSNIIVFSQKEEIISNINAIQEYIYNTQTDRKNIASIEVYKKIKLTEPIFVITDVPEEIYNKMIGNSIPLEYKEKVNIKNYSYLQLSYYGFDNKTYVGEMIVNKNVANDVLDIFKELYEIKYPIEKIKLIDEYEGKDELSMEDNNTSCFCYRNISGTLNTSKHAIGMAIDINPLYNPYVTKKEVSPVSGKIYANRELKNKYQIDKNDAIYKIFNKHGWSWGGDWKTKKDYQHFEKK